MLVPRDWEDENTENLSWLNQDHIHLGTMPRTSEVLTASRVLLLCALVQAATLKSSLRMCTHLHTCSPQHHVAADIFVPQLWSSGLRQYTTYPIPYSIVFACALSPSSLQLCSVPRTLRARLENQNAILIGALLSRARREQGKGSTYSSSLPFLTLGSFNLSSYVLYKDY